MLRWVVKPLAKFVRAREGRTRLVGNRPLGGDHTGSQRALQIELHPIPVGGVAEPGRGLDAAPEIGDRLEMGGARRRTPTGLEPV